MRIKNLVEMIKHNGLLTSMAQLEKLYRIAIENEEKLAESEARCAALAAENAGLKAFGDKLNEMHNDLNGEGTGIQGRAEVACQQVALEAAMEEFDAIKTPATDAFLAEVRASAIEHAAAERWGSGYIFNELNELAAQIRKGVQS